jgi:hypothetical protein
MLARVRSASGCPVRRSKSTFRCGKETDPLDMRNHDTQHLLRPSRVAERFVREPDWPLRQAGSTFARHSLTVIVVLAWLLALALAVLLLVAVRRVRGGVASRRRAAGLRFASVSRSRGRRSSR